MPIVSNFAYLLSSTSACQANLIQQMTLVLSSTGPEQQPSWQLYIPFYSGSTKKQKEKFKTHNSTSHSSVSIRSQLASSSSMTCDLAAEAGPIKASKQQQAASVIAAHVAALFRCIVVAVSGNCPSPSRFETSRCTKRGKKSRFFLPASTGLKFSLFLFFYSASFLLENKVTFGAMRCQKIYTNKKAIFLRFARLLASRTVNGVVLFLFQLLPLPL